MVRPDQRLTISANILKMEYESFTITGIVRKLNGDTYEEIASTQFTATRPGMYDIDMVVSITPSTEQYKSNDKETDYTVLVPWLSLSSADKAEDGSRKLLSPCRWILGSEPRRADLPE